MDNTNEPIPELPYNSENDLEKIAEISQNLILSQILSPYSTEETLILAEYSKPELSHEERMELINLADECENKKALYIVSLLSLLGGIFIVCFKSYISGK